jgi:hypothetical protein
MMVQSVDKHILEKVSKAGKGSLFFADSFSSYGSHDAIRQALSRLVKKDVLVRVAQGIYVRPKVDDVLGVVMPDIEDIAIAIARRDKARIVPTGTYALHRLGLSAQVPLNVVYLTDGAARKVHIGNRTITFKRSTPKNVAAVGEISRLAIQALRTIGKEKVTPAQIEHIHRLLRNERRTRLEHDIRLAPVWIRELMKPVLNELKP